MALGSARSGVGMVTAQSAVPLRAGRGPWRAARRRRRMPFVAVGGLLVVLCVLGYAYGAVRLGDRVQVLAVARPVSAGQVFAAADLRTVSAARDATVTLIAASDSERVIGRMAVVPLLPGTLLTSVLVGDAAFPPAGKVAASVAVKPGQYPRGLVAGAHVLAYITSGAVVVGQPVSSAASLPSGGAGATSPFSPGTVAVPGGRPIPAVVLGVDLAGDGQGATVVSLLFEATEAGRLAGAGSGGVVLVQSAPEGR